jgi:hypothetical protein
VIASIGTIAYIRPGAHTSFGLLAVSLFVRGIGFGFVMMPAISAAYQTLAPPQVPRASAAINIVQRIGGSIGTALVAVALEHQISVQVRGLSGGLSSASTVPSAGVAKVAKPLSTAFANTFGWVLAMTILALVPVVLLARTPAGRSRPPPPPSTECADRAILTPSGPVGSEAGRGHTRYSRVLTVKRVP